MDKPVIQMEIAVHTSVAPNAMACEVCIIKEVSV